MKRRLLIPLVFTGLALASGLASANPSYWRQYGLLLEVSADPRDGRDFVRVDATPADQLELIALNDTVTLRQITLRLADGRAITRPMRAIHPGQRIMLDLPRHRSAIVAVELDYGHPAHRRYDRTPARLQIIPHRARWTPDYHHNHHAAPYYDRGVPHDRYPQWSRQRDELRGWSWSGSVHGRFRF